MGLGAALVDRARRVVKEAATERVEGTTHMAEVHGPWFRARLTLAGEVDTPGVEASYRRVVRTPTLMFGVKNTEGEPVGVRFDDVIEVDSPQLGRGRWQVNGQPEPMRKKRTVIGYTVRLLRIEDGG